VPLHSHLIGDNPQNKKETQRPHPTSKPPRERIAREDNSLARERFPCYAQDMDMVGNLQEDPVKKVMEVEDLIMVLGYEWQ
jgi:hypothetical protein